MHIPLHYLVYFWREDEETSIFAARYSETFLRQSFDKGKIAKKLVERGLTVDLISH